MDELIEKLKHQIIAQLNLAEINATDIDANAPLFGDGLGLDSIDALELIVLLEKEYNLRLENPADGRQIFHSVRSMAEYIHAHGKS